MARMGENRSVCKFLVGKPEEKNHLEDLRVDVRAILRLILRKWHGKLWTKFVCLRTGTTGGLLCRQDYCVYRTVVSTGLNIPGWLVNYLLSRVGIMKLFIL